MRKLYYVYDTSIARSFSMCFVCFVIVSVDTGRSSRPPQGCYCVCAVVVWAYPLADVDCVRISKDFKTTTMSSYECKSLFTVVFLCDRLSRGTME